MSINENMAMLEANTAKIYAFLKTQVMNKCRKSTCFKISIISELPKKNWKTTDFFRKLQLLQKYNVFNNEDQLMRLPGEFKEKHANSD